MRRRIEKSYRAGTAGLLGLLRIAAIALMLSAGSPAFAETSSSSGDASKETEMESHDTPKSRNALIDRWRRATRDERREMRANQRERRRDASPRQRRRFERRLNRLERSLPDFSAIERMMLLRAAAELPEAERNALRKQVSRIDDLSPDDRQAFIAELKEMIRKVGPEVERLERNRRRWDGMSDAEREEFRGQMKKLRSMTPLERRALFAEMERNRTR